MAPKRRTGKHAKRPASSSQAPPLAAVSTHSSRPQQTDAVQPPPPATDLLEPPPPPASVSAAVVGQSSRLDTAHSSSVSAASDTPPASSTAVGTPPSGHIAEPMLAPEEPHTESHAEPHAQPESEPDSEATTEQLDAGAEPKPEPDARPLFSRVTTYVHTDSPAPVSAYDTDAEVQGPLSLAPAAAAAQPDVEDDAAAAPVSASARAQPVLDTKIQATGTDAHDDADTYASIAALPAAPDAPFVVADEAAAATEEEAEEEHPTHVTAVTAVTAATSLPPHRTNPTRRISARSVPLSSSALAGTSNGSAHGKGYGNSEKNTDPIKGPLARVAFRTLKSVDGRENAFLLTHALLLLLHALLHRTLLTPLALLVSSPRRRRHRLLQPLSHLAALLADARRVHVLTRWVLDGVGALGTVAWETVTRRSKPTGGKGVGSDEGKQKQLQTRPRSASSSSVSSTSSIASSDTSSDPTPAHKPSRSLLKTYIHSLTSLTTIVGLASEACDLLAFLSSASWFHTLLLRPATTAVVDAASSASDILTDPTSTTTTATAAAAGLAATRMTHSIGGLRLGGAPRTLSARAHRIRFEQWSLWLGVVSLFPTYVLHRLLLTRARGRIRAAQARLLRAIDASADRQIARTRVGPVAVAGEEGEEDASLLTLEQTLQKHHRALRRLRWEHRAFLSDALLLLYEAVAPHRDKALVGSVAVAFSSWVRIGLLRASS